jgi:hypothetical protein
VEPGLSSIGKTDSGHPAIWSAEYRDGWLWVQLLTLMGFYGKKFSFRAEASKYAEERMNPAILSTGNLHFPLTRCLTWSVFYGKKIHINPFLTIKSHNNPYSSTWMPVEGTRDSKNGMTK